MRTDSVVEDLPAARPRSSSSSSHSSSDSDRPHSPVPVSQLPFLGDDHGRESPPPSDDESSSSSSSDSYSSSSADDGLDNPASDDESVTDDESDGESRGAFSAVIGLLRDPVSDTMADAPDGQCQRLDPHRAFARAFAAMPATLPAQMADDPVSPAQDELEPEDAQLVIQGIESIAQSHGIDTPLPPAARAEIAAALPPMSEDQHAAVVDAVQTAEKNKYLAAAAGLGHNVSGSALSTIGVVLEQLKAFVGRIGSATFKKLLPVLVEWLGMAVRGMFGMGDDPDELGRYEFADGVRGADVLGAVFANELRRGYMADPIDFADQLAAQRANLRKAAAAEKAQPGTNAFANSLAEAMRARRVAIAPDGGDDEREELEDGARALEDALDPVDEWEEPSDDAPVPLGVAPPAPLPVAASVPLPPLPAVASVPLPALPVATTVSTPSSPAPVSPAVAAARARQQEVIDRLRQQVQSSAPGAADSLVTGTGAATSAAMLSALKRLTRPRTGAKKTSAQQAADAARVYREAGELFDTVGALLGSRFDSLKPAARKVFIKLAALVAQIARQVAAIARSLPGEAAAVAGDVLTDKAVREAAANLTRVGTDVAGQAAAAAVQGLVTGVHATVSDARAKPALTAQANSAMADRPDRPARPSPFRRERTLCWYYSAGASYGRHGPAHPHGAGSSIVHALVARDPWLAEEMHRPAPRDARWCRTLLTADDPQFFDEIGRLLSSKPVVASAQVLHWTSDPLQRDRAAAFFHGWLAASSEHKRRLATGHHGHGAAALDHAAYRLRA